jgi:uncharacterized protein (DUF952 family)
MTVLIFKICHAAEWRTAATSSAYDGSLKDKADGFLHFSTEEQLMGTLLRHYVGAGDLVLVAVDAEALGDALKFEPSRDGALFPHLYGELPLDAVKWTRPITQGENGKFNLPAMH